MFTVTVVAGNLVSKSTGTRVFVGHGCPAAPVVDASWADGQMKLSWKAVTTSADGGYLDPAKVTYRITDKASGNTIAEDLTATEHTFAIAEPETLTIYQYDVTALYEGNSATATSQPVALGSLYPETISVYYSASGRETGDFLPVEGMTHIRVPRDWTFYSADLPAGARFFAIRNHGTNTYMLMVDDIDFTTGSINSYLEVKGYDIYRVTTVYNLGVSAGSNAVTIYDAGINAAGAPITVSGHCGIITVKGAQGMKVTVSDMSGHVIHTGMAAATERVAVSAGIYLVSVNSNTVKLSVD